MEQKQKVICINCPLGCHLEVSKQANGDIHVEGNSCKRGITYGISEVTAPMRVLTTTVKCENGELNRLPVKTKEPIPKGSLLKAMEVIKQVTVKAPVKIGDIIVRNILGTEVDVIACRSIMSKERYEINEKAAG